MKGWMLSFATGIFRGNTTARMMRKKKRADLSQRPDFLIISPGLGGRIYTVSVMRALLPIQVIGPDYMTLEWVRRDLSWYGCHFDRNDSRIRCDASEFLVFLPSFAIEIIRNLYPDLRIVFVLQEPAGFCLEYIRNLQLYGKGVFSGRFMYHEPPTDSMILESLSSDDLLSRIDYGPLIRRWSDVFSSSRIHVAYLENAMMNPESFFERILDFLDMPLKNSGTSFPVWSPAQIAMSERHKYLVSSFASEKKRNMIDSLYSLTKEKGFSEPPWDPADEIEGLPYTMIDRRKSWRIFMEKGLFHAVDDMSGLSVSSGYLSDLIRGIPGRGGAVTGRELEDSRLCRILSETAKVVKKERQCAEFLNGLSLADSYRLYNILITGKGYTAIPQAMGPVDLFRETLGEREIPPHILSAMTVEALKKKIDLTLDGQKAGSSRLGIIDRWF
jgi:hypothetical protein